MPSDKNPLKSTHGPPSLKNLCGYSVSDPSYSLGLKQCIALVVIELSFLTKYRSSFALPARSYLKKVKWEQTVEICLEFACRDFGNIFYSTKITKWRFVSSSVNYNVINIYQLFSHLLFCLYLALWRTSSINGGVTVTIVA